MDSREIYIATKPARFDRDYGIGEVITTGVIDPGSERRLIEMGKIQRVMMRVESGELREESFLKMPLTLNSEGDEAAVAPVSPPDELVDADDTNIPTYPEATQDEPLCAPQQEAEMVPAAEPFTCHVCGRVMATKSALTNHLKTHNQT